MNHILKCISWTFYECVSFPKCQIEEKQRDLCCLVIQFIPPISPPQLPGSVFRQFLQNLLIKNRGADRNVPPPGISNNSVLVSLYSVILYFLSEGFPLGDICGWSKSCENNGSQVGFLHRGGQQTFPLSLILRNDPDRAEITRLGGSYNHLLIYHPLSDHLEAEVVGWEEGCMDDEESRVTHLSRQKPCCCSDYNADFTRIMRGPISSSSKGLRVHCGPISERSAHDDAAECSTGSLNDEISDKAGSSDQSDADFTYLPLQNTSTVAKQRRASGCFTVVVSYRSISM